MRVVVMMAVLLVTMSAVAVAEAPTVSTVGALKDPGLGIALGPDGALWHTSRKAVGTTTTDGRTTEFGLGKDADARAIVAGGDGALWFVHHVHAIARVSTREP